MRSLSLLLTGAALAGVACTDTGERFDDFQPIDATPRPSHDAMPIPELPDITGQFLVSMAFVSQPEPVFESIADVTFTDNGDGTGVASVQFTALDYTTRMPIGDKVGDGSPAPVNNAGEFTVNFDGVVPAEGNPVTGFAITLDAVIHLTIKSEDAFCGTVEGGVTNPIQTDVTGSQVIAVRIVPGTVGDLLPAPPMTCPEPGMPGDPDAGPPDAGTPDASVPDASVPDAGAVDGGGST